MQQIGPYRLAEELGRGGMATVYRVLDPHENVFALKLLHPGPSQDKRWGTRFQREFRLLSRLRHAHLIEVHDYGEDDGQAYYVMDYVNGKNLWTFYREDLRGKSTVERLSWLIPLLSQLVSALDYIHYHRVIHKDLKPANILLEHNGTNAYLVDFGLARELKDSAMFTHPGFIGTLGYSPPEMVERGRLDGRADIYSLGVILYTLLADRRPIQVEGRSFMELLHAIRSEEPTPIERLLSDIPLDVAHMIHRCIQKDPADRYRNARELWRDMLPILAAIQSSQIPRDNIQEAPALHSSPVASESDIASEASVSHAGLWVESEQIGRDYEYAICSSKWSEVYHQKCTSLLLFKGSAGVGKSFFLEEWMRELKCNQHAVYHQKIRPQEHPFGSLGDLIRPLIQALPISTRHCPKAQWLAQYIPSLQDLLPQPVRAAETLLQPVQQISELILYLAQLTPLEQPFVWMIDDIHHADSISRQIISACLDKLVSETQIPMLFVATLTDTETSEVLTLSSHPRIEEYTLAPFTAEEEALFITRLSGREPTYQELHQIRNATRGLPMRTLELVHQGALFANNPASSEPAAPASDLISSVSTALHNISDLQEALGLRSAPSQSVEPIQSIEEPVLKPDPSEHTVLTYQVDPDALSSSTSGEYYDAFEASSHTVDPFLSGTDNAKTSMALEVLPSQSQELPVILGALPSTQLQAEAFVPIEHSASNEEDILEVELDMLIDEEELLYPEEDGQLIYKYGSASSELLEGTADPFPTITRSAYVPEDSTEAPVVSQDSESSNYQSEHTMVQASPDLQAWLNKVKVEEPSEQKMPSQETISVDESEEPEVGEQTFLQSDVQALPMLKKPKLDLGNHTLTAPKETSGNIEQIKEPIRRPHGRIASHHLNDVKHTLNTESPVRSVDDLRPPAAPFEYDAEDAEYGSMTQLPNALAFEIPEDAESSGEWLFIPILHKRLDLLEPKYRQCFAMTALLPEAFIYQELQNVLQFSPEETLDLINELLSLRLLQAEAHKEEEYYRYFHPVTRRILQTEIPSEQLESLSLRAAHAMVDSRETYHRTNNPGEVAQRFMEGGAASQSLRWQIFAVQKAFKMGVQEQLFDAIQQLQELVEHWKQQGRSGDLHASIEEHCRPAPEASILEQLSMLLIRSGLWLAIADKNQASKDRQTVRKQLRSLLTTQQDSLQSNMNQLQPLFEFAHLRVRKKK